jgi:23S rRNA pseudoU1915 N3-methylase RlmH
MKSFQQFLKESITINGDFNGTLNVGGSQPEQTSESFLADVVWQGKIYRMEVEGKMMSKNELAEQLQRTEISTRKIGMG